MVAVKPCRSPLPKIWPMSVRTSSAVNACALVPSTYMCTAIGSDVSGSSVHPFAVTLSAPAVKRRVDRLRDEGVIRGYTVRLDPAALGWQTEAFVELFCHGSTSPATMQTAIEQYPEVMAASTVTGDVDVVLQVRARDMRHLERVVERLAAEPFVARTRSTIVLSALVRRPEGPAAPPE